jgi:GT2 family glycosyltransferase
MFTLVIVGINKWKKYTKPLLQSLDPYDKKIEVVLIDNASNPAYPESTYRFEKLVSYAEANNMGATFGSADVLVFINNDTRCTGDPSFLSELPPGKIYAEDVRLKEDYLDTRVDFLFPFGWITIVDRKLFERMGGFNNDILPGGADDVEFGFRAFTMGIPLEEIKVPFIHYGSHDRKKIIHFYENREKNDKYLRNKILEWKESSE